MNSALYTDADLYAVACAGDPHLRSIGAPTDEEMALVNACVAIEADLREREWAAFEIARQHIVDGVVVPPAGPEGVKVAIAVYELGWHYPVPCGEEC